MPRERETDTRSVLVQKAYYKISFIIIVRCGSNVIIEHSSVLCLCDVLAAALRSFPSRLLTRIGFYLSTDHPVCRIKFMTRMGKIKLAQNCAKESRQIRIPA